MTATKRQTAGNNATLRRIKLKMNAATYKKIMDAWNNGGEDYAMMILSHDFNTEAWPRVKAELTQTRD